MPTSETPKFSGPHRRWGRPFGELSRLHRVVSLALLLMVLIILAALLGIMMR
jgi:hypothetical protein